MRRLIRFRSKALNHDKSNCKYRRIFVVDRFIFLVTLSGILERRHTTTTVPVLDRFGWTTFNVTALREILVTVYTTPGVYTAVNITMTSLFSVLQVGQTGRKLLRPTGWWKKEARTCFHKQIYKLPDVCRVVDGLRFAAAVFCSFFCTVPPIYQTAKV